MKISGSSVRHGLSVGFRSSFAQRRRASLQHLVVGLARSSAGKAERTSGSDKTFYGFAHAEVDAVIRRMRSLKIDENFDHPLIHTRRGEGYIFSSEQEIDHVQ